MKTTIYLIRHAESIANESGLYGGTTDYPLSKRGLAQAEALATRLSGIEFDAIYSSPLTRAKQTITPLAKNLGKEIIEEPNLKEIFVGEWEGIMWSELEIKYPKETRFIRETEWHTGMKGQEETDIVAKRMLEVITRISKENPGKTIVATSHIQAIRAFLCATQNVPYYKIKSKLGYIPNTGVTVLEYDSITNKFTIKSSDQIALD